MGQRECRKGLELLYQKLPIGVLSMSRERAYVLHVWQLSSWEKCVPVNT